MYPITIKYGIRDKSIDITQICFSRFRKDDKIYIPSTEHIRVMYFSDPLQNVHKSIIIKINEEETEFDEYHHVTIDLSANRIISVSDTEIDRKLESIHYKLQMKHGELHDELPEQKTAIRFLTGYEKILEIGGNVGRNSLVIASILRDSSDLVTLESDSEIAEQLVENRDINNLYFHIENRALSKNKLIQKGWDTKPSDILEDGFFWVKTFTYDDLKSKYNIQFDTLVIDCEGAFYYILQDFPEILENIQLIIIENDFTELSHKQYVDKILKDNHFKIMYKEGGAFWVAKFEHLWDNFYEVWRRFDSIENIE